MAAQSTTIAQVRQRLSETLNERVLARGRQLAGYVLLEHERGSREARGRTYLVSGVGGARLHTASAPGQPLAQLSGAFRASISYQRVEDGSVEVGVDDAAVAEYVRVWEVDAPKGEQRPTFRLALNRYKRDVAAGLSPDALPGAGS
jgi:hypothetical protein